MNREDKDGNRLWDTEDGWVFLYIKRKAKTVRLGRVLKRVFFVKKEPREKAGGRGHYFFRDDCWYECWHAIKYGKQLGTTIRTSVTTLGYLGRNC